MPQSLSKVIVHIIFSTKNREPFLDSDMRPRMHAYLATICRDPGAELVRVGGVADHVHIVTTLPRTLSQAELVEQIKKTSSKWIKELNASYRGFFWQRGYGVFSVSPSQFEAMLQYINEQQEHQTTAAGSPRDRATSDDFCGAMRCGLKRCEDASHSKSTSCEIRGSAFLISRQFWECARVLAPLSLAWLEHQFCPMPD